MNVLSEEQVAQFNKDGFLVVENFIDPELCARGAARFEHMFAGEFDAGCFPDSINFGEGFGSALKTNQLDNSWKCDYTMASLWMNKKVGQALTQLMGGRGVMMGQDITIWKKPGAQPLVYHQDSSYASGMKPGFVFSCAISLTETSPAVGTIEYIPGSHQWELAPPQAGDSSDQGDYFYGKDDYRAPAYEAAKQQGIELTEDDFVKIQGPVGSVVFHHSHVWHGAGPNVSDTEERRVIVGQVQSCDTVWEEGVPTDVVSQFFRKYKEQGTNIPNESFFPILWREDGYRTPWVDDYIANAPK